MPKPGLKLAIALAFTLVGLTGFALLAREPRTSLAVVAERNAQAAASQFALRDGASQAYTWSQTVSLAGGDVSMQGSTLETRFEGRLNLRVLDANAGTIAVQLSPLSVTLDGQRSGDLEKALSRPFVVSLDERGNFGLTKFAEDVAPGDRMLLDNILRSLQVVLPAEPAHRWSTSERDRNGEYGAEYHWREPGAALVKRKSRYLPASGASFTISVLESSMEARVDRAHFWVRSVKGSERLKLAGPGSRALAQVDSHVALDAISDPPAADLALWSQDWLQRADATVEAAPTTAPSSWDLAARELERERIRRSGVQLEDLLSNLNTHGHDPAFARTFAAFLNAFPDAAARLPEQLGRLGSTESATLFGILKQAGTPEVQATVLAIAENDLQSADNRTRALIALSGMEAPLPETAARLAALYSSMRRDPSQQQIASTAVLSLGALAQQTTGEQRDAVADLLAGELRRATEPEDKRILLRAFENGRIAMPLDSLQEYLHSDSARVREVAASLISQTGDPQGQAELLRVLRNEESDAVRRAAVGSLAHLSVDAATNLTIRKALPEEESTEVRLEMVRFLTANRKNFPENRETLRAELSRETDRRIITTILNALPEVR